MNIRKVPLHSSHQEFYGDSLEILQEEIEKVGKQIKQFEIYDENIDRQRIEHFKWRIKSPQSIQEKLKKKGMPFTIDHAFTHLYDYVGGRIICTFLDDIYSVRDYFSAMENVHIVEEKDYVKYPKPNGYRSYHLLLNIDRSLKENIPKMHMEIQIRTISQDSWASLEHQLKYKKNIGHSEVIIEELKRCADEMASTDLTMQTIRDWIDGKIEEE